MLVLLDECLPRRLKRAIVGHDVRTAPEMGWAGKRNGDLLRLAQEEFDAFLTVDRNLAYQQPVSSFSIGVIVMVAKGNTLQDLQPLIPHVLVCLQTIRPGQLILVPVRAAGS